MITEAQRRALFALREALHLCEAADVEVYQAIGCVGVAAADYAWQQHSLDGTLCCRDIDLLLEKHPEASV